MDPLWLLYPSSHSPEGEDVSQTLWPVRRPIQGTFGWQGIEDFVLPWPGAFQRSWGEVSRKGNLEMSLTTL